MAVKCQHENKIDPLHFLI